MPYTINVPYLIKVGDTLSEIAERFLGNSHRFTELAELNHIPDASMIHAGATILIPVPLTADLMSQKVIQVALGPKRLPYPPTVEEAVYIFLALRRTYQPVWDRDVDDTARGRREGMILLAQALGLLDDAEAQAEQDATDKLFNG